MARVQQKNISNRWKTEYGLKNADVAACVAADTHLIAKEACNIWLQDPSSVNTAARLGKNRSQSSASTYHLGLATLHSGIRGGIASASELDIQELERNAACAHCGCETSRGILLEEGKLVYCPVCAALLSDQVGDDVLEEEWQQYRESERGLAEAFPDKLEGNKEARHLRARLPLDSGLTQVAFQHMLWGGPAERRRLTAKIQEGRSQEPGELRRARQDLVETLYRLVEEVDASLTGGRLKIDSQAASGTELPTGDPTPLANSTDKRTHFRAKALVEFSHRRAVEVADALPKRRAWKRFKNRLRSVEFFGELIGVFHLEND